MQTVAEIALEISYQLSLVNVYPTVDQLKKLAVLEINSMENQSTHTAVVGAVTDMIGDTGDKPYQKIRLAVSCDGEEPDEIITLLADYSSSYHTHDVVLVSRWRKGNITSYKLVKE